MVGSLLRRIESKDIQQQLVVVRGMQVTTRCGILITERNETFAERDLSVGVKWKGNGKENGREVAWEVRVNKGGPPTKPAGDVDWVLQLSVAPLSALPH